MKLGPLTVEREWKTKSDPEPFQKLIFVILRLLYGFPYIRTDASTTGQIHDTLFLSHGGLWLMKRFEYMFFWNSSENIISTDCTMNCRLKIDL